MSSRRTGEASQLTSALTGASVALGIAREAADAIPIVKQVLGATLRIVALAEKMDTDREALRALGASSLQLARQVTAVMAGKTPDDGIQASLERIMKALDDIEKFMKQHAARSRVRRFMNYAFTVPQHVKRLSGELADAVRNLTVIALLSVDHQAHATRSAVEDNARFEGEFRLLRHCEVQKPERIFDFEDTEDEKPVVRYHRAHVDGQLLVVRYFEGSRPQDSPSGQEHDETMFNRISVHDAILEEISTVQKSHRNVARIYGWSRGSGRERFTVFKSGYQPVHNALRNSPNPLTNGIHWTVKLLDAAHHLRLLGINWHPGQLPYVLDDQLQPIIGLQNDLSRSDLVVDQVGVAYRQLFRITWPLSWFKERKSVPAAKIQKLLAGCLDKRLADLLGRMETFGRARYRVPKEEFSHRRILMDTSAESLLRIVEHELFDYSGAMKAGLYGIDEDLEHIVHDRYLFDVPDEKQDEFREMFGISAPSEMELWTSRLVATGTYRMLSD